MATARILLPLLGGSPDPTNPPTVGWTAANRPYLIMDGTTDNLVTWIFEVPDNYSSGLTVRVKYSLNTATTGNVAIRTETQSDADGEDVETDAWSTVEASADQAVPGNATHMKTITDALTVPTIAANDYLAIRIGRENAAGSNASGQMFWWSVALEYTTT